MNISTTSVNWTWCSTSTRWAPGRDEGGGAGGGAGGRAVTPPHTHSPPAQCLSWCPCPGSRAPGPPASEVQTSTPGSHQALSSPHFTQVYTVVDEMFLAGEIRETSQTKVLKQLLMLQSLE